MMGSSSHNAISSSSVAGLDVGLLFTFLGRFWFSVLLFFNGSTFRYPQPQPPYYR